MKELSLATLKKLAMEKGHILLSESQYIKLKEQAVLEYVPTAAERRAIKQGRLAYREGKTVSLEELERELERRA